MVQLDHRAREAEAQQAAAAEAALALRSENRDLRVQAQGHQVQLASGDHVDRSKPIVTGGLSFTSCHPGENQELGPNSEKEKLLCRTISRLSSSLCLPLRCRWLPERAAQVEVPPG